MSIDQLVQFYVPADPELAKGNKNYTLDFLKKFYRNAYSRMRPHMKDGGYIVFCDAFELDIWDDFLLHEGMIGVCLDTHHYLMTPDLTLFKEKNLTVYQEYLGALGERLRAAGRRIPLIVGEWNAQNQADGLAEMNEEEKDALYSGVSEAFRAGMTECLGWFYWTWKVMLEGPDADCDDAGRYVTRGWLK